MTLSAVFLGSMGIALSFLPAEIAGILNIKETSSFLVMLQVLGSLYFAFAMLNWMAKGSIIGGIYNRPIVIANFTHFFMGALALGKSLVSNPELPETGWFLAVIYAILAALYGIFLFRHPLANSPV
jgi:hypothetical protein